MTDHYKPLTIIYPGEVASMIVKGLGAMLPIERQPDQHQANGLYGVHQLRVRLPGDPTVYRVLIAPADAPISIGGVAADHHFSEPLVERTP